MGVAAEKLGKAIPEVGTTTFRPAYTPVTFGALAGREIGKRFDPVRTTAMHEWHVEHGAEFETVGQWLRPWYFPKDGETMDEAVARECLAVRDSVGMLDASTLGKIEIKGKDAAKFLNMMYTNPFLKLGVGKKKAFIGDRSLQRADSLCEGRKELVGLVTKDPKTVIPEGAQLLNTETFEIPADMQGHITSSYYSHCLEKSIAMALVKGGLSRMGETIYSPQPDGSSIEATIVSPVFYDEKGERRDG